MASRQVMLMQPNYCQGPYVHGVGGWCDGREYVRIEGSNTGIPLEECSLREDNMAYSPLVSIWLLV